MEARDKRPIDRSTAKAEVNRRVREAADRFELADSGFSTWEFLCECDAAGCVEWVSLTLEQLAELERANAAILAPGHSIQRAAEPVSQS